MRTSRYTGLSCGLRVDSLITIAVLSIASSAHAQNSILLDGDFSALAPSGNTGFIRYCGGMMGAWSIPQGQGVEVISPSLCGCLCGGGPCYGDIGCSPTGGAYLRMHNNYWQCSYGSTTSILQNVQVRPGNLYELEMDAASELGNTVEVSDGTRTYSFGTGHQWQQVRAMLKWQSSTGTVSITRAAIGANNPCSGPFISHLSLVDRGPDCNNNLIVDSQEIDCNHNGIPDSCDIANGTSTDYGHDGIPDECQCFADLNGSHAVDGADIGIMLAFWGLTSTTFPMADINRDGNVNGADLGILLANWGPCTN
jgi:hypothetical protein